MDWTCACGMSNSAEANFCNQCGAPKPAPQGAVAPEPTPPLPPPAPPEPPASSPPAPPLASPHVPPPPPAPAQPQKKGGCAKWIVLALAILLALCLIGGAVVGVLIYKGGKRVSAFKERFLKKAATVTDVAKQQAAIVEMKSIGAALESYKNDKGAYPTPGHNPDSYYSLVDLDAVRSALVPKYTAELPKDPWGNAFEYGSSPDDQSYVLICKGSDGVDKLEKIPETPVETRCFEDEIVLEKGEFMQKPGGEQRSCAGGGGE